MVTIFAAMQTRHEVDKIKVSRLQLWCKFVGQPIQIALGSDVPSQFGAGDRPDGLISTDVFETVPPIIVCAKMQTRWF